MKHFFLFVTIFIIVTYSGFANNIIWNNKGYNINISCFSKTPDNRYIALGFYLDWDKVQVVDLTTKDTVFQLSGYAVTSIAISKDASTLAFYDANLSKLFVWDINNKTKILEDSIAEINNMKFLPDGKSLIVYEYDWKFFKYDIASKTKTDITFYNSTSTSNLKDVFDISPDGKYLAAIKYESLSSVKDSMQNVILYNLESKTVTNLYGHKFMIKDVVFSNDGKTLASGGGTTNTVYPSETAFIWNVETGSLIKAIYGPHTFISHLSFSPDDSIVYVLSLYGGFINKYQISTSTLLDSLNTYRLISNGFLYKDTSWIYTTGEKLIQFNLGNESIQKIYNSNRTDMHNGTVHSVDISPDDKYVVTCANDYLVKLWDFKTGNFIKNFAEHNSSVMDVQFSPDGKYIASCSYKIDGKLVVREVSNGKLLFEKSFKPSGLICFSYSPDGTMLAVAGQLDSIYVYNALNGNLIKSLYSSSKYAMYLTIAFSKDSKYLAIAPTYKYLKIWETTNWNSVYDKKAYDTVYENNGQIYKLRFLNNSNKLALACDDGYVRFFNMNSLTIDDSITTPNENGFYGLVSIDFTKDEKYVFLTGGAAALKISMNDYSNYYLYDDIFNVDGYNFQYGIKLSNDSKSFITGSAYGNVIKWDSFITTSVKDNLKQDIVSFFPNPASDNIKFNYGLDLPQQLCIYDIYGNIIKEIIPNNINEEISVQDINSGVYNVHVIYKDKIKYSKLNIIR